MTELENKISEILSQETIGVSIKSIQGEHPDEYYLPVKDRGKWLKQITQYIKDNYILTEKK